MASKLSMAAFTGQWTVRGDPGWVPNGLGRLANIFEYVDTVSMIRGHHSLTLGVNAERVQTSVRNAQNELVRYA